MLPHAQGFSSCPARSCLWAGGGPPPNAPRKQCCGSVLTPALSALSPKGSGEMLSLPRRLRSSAAGTPDSCCDVSGQRSSQHACERAWAWAHAGVHVSSPFRALRRADSGPLCSGREGASVPFRVGASKSPLAVKFVPWFNTWAVEGAALQITGLASSRLDVSVGPRRFLSACWRRDLDPHEKPLPTPLTMCSGRNFLLCLHSRVNHPGSFPGLVRPRIPHPSRGISSVAEDCGSPCSQR